MPKTKEATTFDGRLRIAAKENLGTIEGTAVAEKYNAASPSRPVQVSLVRQWLTGQTMPTPGQLRVLAKLVDRSVTYLVEGDVTKPLPKRNKKVKESDVSEGHKLELADRSNSLNVMFEQLIADHPAAALVPAEIQKAREAINNLYQAAGQVLFNHEEAAK